MISDDLGGFLKPLIIVAFSHFTLAEPCLLGNNWPIWGCFSFTQLAGDPFGIFVLFKAGWVRRCETRELFLAKYARC